MYEYNIIKETDLSLVILEESKSELKTSELYKDFNGSTHQDLKDYGQMKHEELGLSSTFGYPREKNNITYWVLPYLKNAVLDVERKDEDNSIISNTYTLEELNNFGFDQI